jgi:hypothetical protein
MKVTKQIYDAYLLCKSKAYLFVTENYELELSEYSRMLQHEAEKGKKIFIAREEEKGIRPPNTFRYFLTFDWN